MVWVVCILIVFLSSCGQKPHERHYKEIIIEAPEDSAQEMDKFSWDLPQGWKEDPGTGMRLASFYLLSDPKAIDCSIVSLKGTVGGLDANLKRWLHQLGIQASDNNLRILGASAQMLKTKDGLEAKIFDFTVLQKQGHQSDKSMISAMIDSDQTIVFVKMTGSMKSVEGNKDSFFKLLRSMARQ